MQYPVTSGSGLDREWRSYFRSLDDLLPDIVYLLPRCDEEITVRKTLSEVAQQFCRETGALEQSCSVALSDNVKRYVIPVGWPADVLVVNTVDLYNVKAGVETLEKTLTPLEYFVDDPDDGDGPYINLNAAVNASGATTYTIKVGVSLIPYADEMLGTEAYGLPDKFLRRWRSAFVNGAAWRLASMDNRPWTNKQMAEDMRRTFFTLVSEATEKVVTSHMKRGGANCRNPVQWC